MVTEVNDKLELENKTNKLNSDVSELKGVISSLNSLLKSVNSYKDIDVASAGQKLASNLENISNDIDTSVKNITTYVDNLLLIDKEDEELETVDSTITNNNIAPLSLNNTSMTSSQVSYSASPSTKETITYTNKTYNSAGPSTPVQTISTSNNTSQSSENPTSSSNFNDVVPVTNPGNSNIDISKYHNRPEMGFEVTTGNNVFNLSASDIDLLCAIVSAESDHSYDDALAVITTILNRCEASNWVASFGTNPVSQATAPNQFVVYQHGSYKQYLNGNAPDTVKQAVQDALSGVRNHHYLSFRSNGSTGYSNNQISPTGNRYK